MTKLIFRCCEAADGRKFAFLTDQPEVEDLFDNGYKVAYKDIDGTNNPELLAHWRHGFTSESQEFTMLEEEAQIPDAVQKAFNDMMDNLIKGIDVFFCDYNLAVKGDLPMCNEVMDSHRSTDFVLFSCADIVGADPTQQPYMVSYAMPRYEKGTMPSHQHRIYCKTDNFAFCQAIKAIVIQRKRDNLMGGHIRTELDGYVVESVIGDAAATAELNRFVDVISREGGSSDGTETKALPSG